MTDDGRGSTAGAVEGRRTVVPRTSAPKGHLQALLRPGVVTAVSLFSVLGPGGAAHALSVQAGIAAALKAPVITEDFRPVLPCDQNTTVGQEGCAEHHVLAADRQLNADIRAVFGFLADDAARRDFVGAQMTWTSYRRSDCISQSDVYEGGTEQPVVYALCLATADASRREDLRGFFQLLTQGRATVPRFP
jgi:uncharacterized protein YecT (DUF1311 family)